MSHAQRRVAMTMTPADKIKVLRDVVDWMEANPFRAIRREPATDFSGFPCDPRTPSAHCFCFIGRLQNVTGLSPYFEEVSLPMWLSDLRVNQNEFIRINDENVTVTGRVCALRVFINDIARGFPVDA